MSNSAFTLSTSVSDADATTKGVLQLAGDLGGSAASPTVTGLSGKAPLASPTFTGTPAAPTAAGGTNTTQLATTAFVTTAVAAVTGSPGGSTTQLQYNSSGAFAGSANLIWDDSNAILKLGGTLAGGNLPTTDRRLALLSTGGLQMITGAFGTTASAGVAGYQGRGTVATPTASQANDILGSLTGRGYGVTQWTSASTGGYFVRANQIHTDTNHGTYLTLEATPDGSSTRAEMLRINGDNTISMDANTTKISTAELNRLHGVAGALYYVGTTVAVGDGGTGQTTYTDGQLLIGNTTGNTLTKATLTGTSNQITVTNGSGTITLSAPQNIHTAATPTFAGVNLGTSNISTVGSIYPDGTAARSIGGDATNMRAASGAGANLTIQAGGAQSGASNTSAGKLILSSGISTGSARPIIELWTAAQGGSGTTDNTPAAAASFFSTSGINAILSIGNVTGTSTGLVGSSNSFALNGSTSGYFQQYRHTTANTAGTNLNVISGGATSGATDKASGDLVLRTGLSTGTGGANVRVQTMTRALSTGTSDNTATDRIIAQSPKSVTNNSATTVASMTNANSSSTVSGVVGGRLSYTVEVYDGTDTQYESGVITYGITNKAGTIANNTVTKTANQQAATAGTLTVTWTITAANPALIQVNANSSLTPSTGYPRVTFVMENLSQQAVTIS